MSILYSIHAKHVNLYDFGHAHGRGVYSDFVEFKKDILNLIERHDRDIYIGVTNSGQPQEHKWLIDIGFDTIKVGGLWVHTITFQKVFSPEHQAELEKRRAEAEALAKEKERLRLEALEKRPRNADGRLLNKDGKVQRHAYEFFVGDRIRWQEWNRDTIRYETKEGTIRSINNNCTANVCLHLRTRNISPYSWDTTAIGVSVIERAQ